MFPSRKLGSAARRPSTARPANVRQPSILQVPARTTETTEQPADPLGRDPRLARLEAALMLADEPVTLRRLADAAELKDGREARTLLQRLTSLYEADDSSFQIVELAGGYQLHTMARYQPWLLRVRRNSQEVRLTPAGLETLAVIAYRQPIMRADIEKIRGVSCADFIRILMEKGFVRVVGRHDSLGRPQLYGTTRRFLQSFGLNTLDNLPEVAALNPTRESQRS